MLVVGRHEHDGRRHRVERRQQLEPGLARHLDVEEQEVGRRASLAEPGEQVARGLRPVGLADDGHAGVVGQEPAHPDARQALVVDEDGAEGPVGHGATSTGS